MNAPSTSPDPEHQPALLQNPMHDEVEFEHDHGHVQHAFDSPEEVAHAKEHAVQNIFWFIGFFCLILCAVATYEFAGTSNWYLIYGLAAARCLLIAFFMNWLFSHFSLIFRTFAFCVIFFIGMVFLSWWDSELKMMGDPIKDRMNPEPVHSHPL